jgi:hypothetical protein
LNLRENPDYGCIRIASEDEPDDGIEFVHGAVRLNAKRVLRNPLAPEE